MLIDQEWLLISQECFVSYEFQSDRGIGLQIFIYFQILLFLFDEFIVFQQSFFGKEVACIHFAVWKGQYFQAIFSTPP